MTKTVTTRFKDFGSPKVEGDPISFKLHGETFHALPSIPGKFLLELVGATQDGQNVSMKMISEFFEQVLTDESFTRFDALLEDKVKVVSAETLVAIIEWLIEEYSNRPEEQPEG